MSTASTNNAILTTRKNAMPRTIKPMLLTILAFIAHTAGVAPLAMAESPPVGPAHLVKDIAPADQPSFNDIEKVTPIAGDRSLIEFLDTEGLWVLDAVSETIQRIDEKLSYIDPTSPVVIDGTLYFSADDGVHGIELWKSDGTIEGTTQVADLNPNGGVYLDTVFVHEDSLYLLGTPSTNRSVLELWRIAIPAANTATLVKRIAGRNTGMFLSSNEIATTNKGFFFTVYAYGGPANSGRELWYSDGSNEGTRPLLTRYDQRGWHDYEFTVVRDVAYFVRYDSGPSDTWSPVLWRSDGTVTGTYAIESPVVDARFYRFYQTKDRLFIAVQPWGSSSQVQLWSYDGTERFSQVPSSGLTTLDGAVSDENGTALYFSALDDTGMQPQLWRSDGSVAGTTLIRSFSDPAVVGIISLKWNNGSLYFVIDELNRRTLWRSNGAPAGTIEIGPVGIAPLEDIGQAYFDLADGATAALISTSLWRIESSPPQMSLLRTFETDFTNIHATSTANGSRIVINESRRRSNEFPRIWISDGTATGTREIPARGPVGSSNPTIFDVMGNRLLFSARDSAGDGALWVSAPDASSAQLAEDAALPFPPGDLINVLNVVNGIQLFAGESALWRVDEASNAYLQIKAVYVGESASTPLRDVAGREWLYFTGDADDVSGLWKTDGTVDGTELILATNELVTADPSSVDETKSISWLTPLGQKVFFRVSQDWGHAWLGVSDGTPQGTHLISGIPNLPNDTFASYGPIHLTTVGDILFFLADDGVHGLELWRSDGTGVGTYMVKDVHPDDLWWLFNWTKAIGSELYYTFNDGTHGWELWKSDGSANGTVMVKDINPNGNSWATVVGEVNGKVLLTADDGIHGQELWLSDGTEQGTALLRDLNPTGSSLAASGFAGVDNGTFYFAANDGVHGIELWKTDGTPQGTVMVQDIAPGPVSSTPSELIIAGDNLYFSADDQIHGRELWAMPVDAAGNAGKAPEESNGGGGAWSVVSLALLLLAIGGRWRSRVCSLRALLSTHRYLATLSIALASSMLVPGNATAQTLPARLVADIAPAGQLDPARIVDVTALANHRLLVRYQTLVGNGSGIVRPDFTDSWIVDQELNVTRRFQPTASKKPLDAAIGVLRGEIYFSINSSLSDDRGLWKSDGTPEGTQRLSDLDGQFADQQGFIQVGDTLFFHAASPIFEGRQLWRTDGTPEGTRLVKEGLSNSLNTLVRCCDWGAALGENLYFTTNDSTQLMQLWKSDGTPDGTVVVAQLGTTVRTGTYAVTATDNRIFVSIDDWVCTDNICTEGDPELWASDGTADGTMLVKDFPPNSRFAGSILFKQSHGDWTFFDAPDESGGISLWRSDGTPENTQPIGGPARALESFKGALYAVMGSISSALSRFDDATGVFVDVKALGTSIGSSQVIGDTLFLLGNDKSLWVSDGTADGTRKVSDFEGYIYDLTPAGDKIVLTATYWDGIKDELWISDGTVVGTVRLPDAGPAGGSHPSHFAVARDRLYFSALDGRAGETLWKTDGNETNTQPYFATPPKHSLIREIPLGAVGERLMFISDRENRRALWATQPDEATPKPVGNDADGNPGVYVMSDEYVAFNDALYFYGSGRDSASPTETANGLWRSDGTDAGTFLLKRCEGGGVCSPQDFVKGTSYLYFSSFSAGDDPTLWRTDGTASGTIALLSNITVDAARMTTANDTLFFAPRDENGTFRLWASDGTPGGTRPISPESTANPLAWIPWTTTVGNAVYFSVLSGPTIRMWRSDGTPEGTVQLDLPIGDDVVSPLPAVAFDDKLVFTTFRVEGNEIETVAWTTDGTADGTTRLKAFNDALWNPTVVKNTLYFAADDGTHGMELWKTDGTPEGTVMVQDIAPGAASSSPDELTLAGDNLYFSADDQFHGRELWALPVDAAGSGGLIPEESTDSGGGGALSLYALLALALFQLASSLVWRRNLPRRSRPGGRSYEKMTLLSS